MSDEAGAAPAAAEPVSAPAPEAEVVSPPNPISTEGEPSKPEPVKTELKAQPKTDDKPPSAREALKRAAEKVEAESKTTEKKPEAKTEAKPEAKAPAKEENRDLETGRFTPKDKPADSEKPAGVAAEKSTTEQPAPVKPTVEAPKRFSEDARKVWDTAPDPVKHEVARMERELTQGIEKHRAGAEKYEAIKQFDELAVKSGTTLPQALSRYIGMEQKLRTDLVGGLTEICAQAGVSLRDVAAHIMGQKPEEVQSQSDATIRELRRELADLKDQIGGVTQTIKQQREQSTLTEVNKFAAEHPRFEELAEDIGLFMQTGRAKDLSEAYELANRLNPAPAPAPAPKPDASSAPAPDLAEQIRKGSKSPTGAPSPGSDPAAKQPSKTARDAVRKAMAIAG